MKKPKKGRRVRNTKAKGSKAELRSMAFYREQGYACIRSAASLGPFDFIAINHQSVVLVQVKVNKWVSSSERKEMESMPVPGNCTKIIHRWDDRVPPHRRFIVKGKSFLYGKWSEFDQTVSKEVWKSYR